MTIKESLEKLDEILKNTESSVIEDNFKDIAEALEIDSDGVDTVEGMVEAIKTSVSSIEESDVEAVVEELSKFFEDDDFEGDGAEIDGKKQNEIKKSKKATEKDAVDKLKEEDEDEDDDEDEEEEEEEEDDDEDEDEEDQAESKKMKKESFYITSQDLDLKEDVAAMFQGEELSEELQNKARTIFEAAVVARVNNKIDQVVEDVNDVLEERVEKIEESYGEKVDEYLTYTVNEWVKDNKLAVESGIRSEMYESFISGMRKVFDDHYINFPEEEISIAEDLQNKVKELEKGLNETLEENAKLHKEIKDVNKKTVVDEVTDGLSESQKDKLVELYENIEIDSNDENFDKFRANAVLIRENYFPKEVSTVEDSDTLIDDAPVDKETITEDRPTNTAVDNYVKTLNRYVK